MPGATEFIHGSDDARLMIALDEEAEFLRPIHPDAARTPDFTWTYDHSAAPSGVDEAVVRGAIEYAMLLWCNLFSAEQIPASFRFEWRDLPSNVLAQAPTSGRDDRSWNNTRASMLGFYSGGDVDSFETGVYESFPTGSSIPYSYLGDPTNETDDISISVPLLIKWFSASSGDPTLIEMNFNRPWDFNGGDGVDAGKFEFEAVMIHEIGHQLGFVSDVEQVTAGFFYDFISNWDVFRLPTSVGTTVDATEMEGSTRQLTCGSSAVACTGLNSSSRLWNLAAGSLPSSCPGGHQASHWLDAASPTSAQYIGIMNPTIGPSVSYTKFGLYLQAADVQAFDVMGYDINEDGVTPAPGASTPSSPTTGPVSPTSPVTFSWSSASSVETYELYINNAGVVGTGGSGPGLQIYAARGLASTSTAVPTGELLPGRVYKWFVTSRNWRGFRQSSVATFTTSGCPADLNNDGVVDFQDYLEFLNLSDSQDPHADLDGDGVVDFSDYLVFLNRFDGGC